MSQAAPSSPQTQYATFRLENLYLGIGVLEVQEVLRDQRLTPVPLAPEAVAGLINLRGQIVPELDLRRVLQLPSAPGNGGGYSVVIRTEQGPVSLRVDEIDDVLELDDFSFEPTPQNLDGTLKNMLLGIHKLNQRLLLILDTHRAVGAVIEDH
jgi:purine-binding chemotaxis protein CheW